MKVYKTREIEMTDKKRIRRKELESIPNKHTQDNDIQDTNQLILTNRLNRRTHNITTKISKDDVQPKSILVTQSKRRQRSRERQTHHLESKEKLDLSILNRTTPTFKEKGMKSRGLKSKKSNYLKGGLFNGKELSNEEDEQFLKRHIVQLDNIKERKRRKRGIGENIAEEDMIIQSSNDKNNHDPYYDNVIPPDYQHTVNDPVMVKVIGIGVIILVIALIVSIAIVSRIFGNQEIIWR